MLEPGMKIVLPWNRWLLVAVAAALLVSCASPTAMPVSGQPSAVPPTSVGIQPTYTPLPTPTPYPMQPTYTPLPTATPYPTLPSRISVPTPSVAPPVTATAVARSDAPDGSGEVSGGAAMLTAINAARLEAVCAPLAPDERLQAAADAHAQDLASRGVIDHRSADGSTLHDRLSRAGYTFARRSEVVGRGTGAGVLAAWLAEPADGPHRGALFDCDYTDAGISERVASDGRSYWVAILANERSP